MADVSSKIQGLLSKTSVDKQDTFLKLVILTFAAILGFYFQLKAEFFKKKY